MADTADQPMSDAEHVREFTFEAGQPTPETPTPMSMDEVRPPRASDILKPFFHA